MTDAVAEDGLKVIVRWIELLVKTVFKGKHEFLGLIFTQVVFFWLNPIWNISVVSGAVDREVAYGR